MEQVKYTYSSSVTDLTEVNSSFDKGIVRVAYHGKNRNGSIISKEAFERSIGTIYGIPIVCNYNRELDEIGSHDVEIVETSRGLELVNITEPVGFIPSDAEYGWELVQEENGDVNEYLWVNCILWKRQEAYKKIKENGITDESMEITVKEGKTKDGCFSIDSFEFTALCLLESAEPCFESACLLMYSNESMSDEFKLMIQEFKNEIKAINAGDSEDINEIFEKGGDTAMAEEKIEMQEIVDEPEVKEDDVPFEPDTKEDVQTEPVAEPEGDFSKESEAKEDNTQDEKDFSLMDSQKSEEITRCLSCAMYTDEYFGETPKYSYIDRDDNEVFVIDWEDGCYYGFPYSFNGDNATVDFECKRRKKCSFVDWEEGMSNAMFDVVNDRVTQSVAITTAKYEAHLRAYEMDIAELSEYKMKKEKCERDAQLDEIFSKFEDIADVAEFTSLKSNCDNMSLEAIENKCFELRGRNMKFNFAVKTEASTRLPVEVAPTPEVKPYDGLFDKFPPRV